MMKPSLSRLRRNRGCSAAVWTSGEKLRFLVPSRADRLRSRPTCRSPSRRTCLAFDRTETGKTRGCAQRSCWTASVAPVAALAIAICPRTCSIRSSELSWVSLDRNSSGCRSWTKAFLDFRRISCYCQRAAEACTSAAFLLRPPETRACPSSSATCKATSSAKKWTRHTERYCLDRLHATPPTSWHSASCSWHAGAAGYCRTWASSKCTAVADSTTRNAWTIAICRPGSEDKAWMVARLCAKGFKITLESVIKNVCVVEGKNTAGAHSDYCQSGGG